MVYSIRSGEPTEPTYTGQEVISAPTGVAPLVVNSTTQVNNLNASLVGGHAFEFISFTTTAVASESVPLIGMTASGHCAAPGPTNASAATNVATTFISAKTTNAITLTHTATAGMTYDSICTSN